MNAAASWCKSLMLAAILLPAAVGCGSAADDTAGSDLELAVSATLVAPPGGTTLTGTIVVDVSLPEGAPARAIALETLYVGGTYVGPAALEGLERFPSELAGGESARVELELRLQGFTWGPEDDFVFPDPACGGSQDLVVTASVLDAEATTPGANVEAQTTVPVTLTPAGPPPFAVARVTDLGAPYDLVAADPSRDDDLLIGGYGRVERVAADGARRWSSTLPGQVLGVGRGGGVDAVLALVHEDLGCERLDGEDSPLDDVVAARLDEQGAIAWCVVLPQSSARMAVNDRGVVAVALGDGSAVPSVLHRVDAEGVALEPLPLRDPAPWLVAAGDVFVAVLTETWTGATQIAFLVDDELRLLPWSTPVFQVAPRRDGSVGISEGGAWLAVDPLTRLVTPLADLMSGVVGAPDLVIEPTGGSILHVGHAGPPGARTLVAEAVDAAGAGGRGTMACEDAWPFQVTGADGEALVAIEATHLVLDGVELAPAGPRRTLVVEMAAP